MMEQFSNYGTAHWEREKKEEATVAPDIGDSSIDGVVLEDGKLLLPAQVLEPESNEKLSHRWVFDNIDEAVEDLEGNAEGSNDGIQSVEGDWVGGSAGDGRGIDGHISTIPLEDLLFDRESPHAVAFSIQFSDTSDDSALVGVSSSSTDIWQAYVNEDGDFNHDPGNIGFMIRDGGGDSLTVHASEDLSDGQPYRIVINVLDPANNNIEIWINQSEYTNIVREENPSNMSSVSEEMAMFSRNNGGTIDQHSDVILDDICIFNESLSQSEIEEYQNPWNNNIMTLVDTQTYDHAPTVMEVDT